MAQRADGCPSRSYLYVRHEENYSFLRDPRCRTEALDGLKFIRLGPDGRSFLSVGGEVRGRYERYSTNAFSEGRADRSGYFDARVMLSADLRLGGWRAFAQARYGGESAYPGPVRAAYEGGPDLHELFVEAPVLPQGVVRIGRQEIVRPLDTPNRRILSAREGPNLRRSFDGLLATTRAVPGLALTGFYTRVVELDPGRFDGSSASTQFWGARAEGSPAQDFGLDGYYYGLADRSAPQANGQRSERHTVGLRLHTLQPIQGFVLDAEGVFQFGRADRRTIRAGFAVIDAEYRIPGAPLGLGLIGRAAYASGDDDPRDGVNGTFDPLFPAGTYFNDGEFLRGSNAVGLRAGLGLRPARGIVFRLSYDEYLRASTRDGVYGISGEKRPGAGQARGRRIGGYVGLAATWQATASFDAAVVAGRFLPGRFFGEAGAVKSADVLRLDARIRF